MLGSLWAFRGFVISSIRREFQARYRNSLLGALWTVLNPLAMILVYTLVFSQLMRARLPGVDNHLAYGFYLCAGFLVWGLFTEITGRSQSMFLDNANLIKKLSFPRICLPTVVIGTALVNFAITFILFLLIISIVGAFPGPSLLALPPLLAIMLTFAAGLGMLLGVLNVFFRDVGQLFGIVVQFWFWLTPIVYPITILPATVQRLMVYNPMAAFIESYQRIFVFGAPPEWPRLLPGLALALLLCGIGAYLFRAHSGEMVDEL